MEEEKTFLEVVRLDPSRRFDPEKFAAVMRQVLRDDLQGKAYNHMYASDWAKSLSRKIHDRLKELDLERYKFAVQVVIGEDRGQGEKYVGGCLWDEDTDGKAVALFTAETIYCVAVAFAVHSYEFK